MLPDIEVSRAAFTKLLAANPNHFGTLSDQILAKTLPVVEPKNNDTRYEEIGCVSFSPERDRLEATIVVKLPAGYGGGPCAAGSTEYVRFFVDYGSGWEDKGVGAARVFDIPAGRDCGKKPVHPYVHVVGVPFVPERKFCSTPVLPRVRAILSWQDEPTAGDAGYTPVWGEIQQETIQIRPRWQLLPHDLPDWLGPLLSVDPEVLKKIIDVEVMPEPIPVPPEAIPEPIPKPGPGAMPEPIPKPGPVPFSTQRLARLYSAENLKALSQRAVDPRVAKLALAPVPPHRFATLEATAALDGSAALTSVAAAALAYKKLDIDWSEVVGVLGDGKGDTSYEGLECLGLDNAAGQLVATFRVKRPTGYSGPPCSAGSKEYIAFWADFDDDCTYTHLGTVTVTTHDFITMPGGGLSYAALLPIDLGAVRRKCTEPGVHKIRAVLSWNTPPSTTDPDAMPYWGNRLDAHVHVLPGDIYDGTAKLTIVGGVATGDIDPATGVTKPGAHLAYNGMPLDARGCPFAGRVTVHGPLDPALAGKKYRLLVRDVTTGSTPTPVLTQFLAVDSNGYASWVTPGADGWLPWPTWHGNTLGTLGYVETSGDDLWEVHLELWGVGVVDTQRFQLDNTLNTASVDPANAAHLAVDPVQLAGKACGKFTKGMTVTGTFDARDMWFDKWVFALSPYALPSGSLATSVPLNTSEAPVGSTWSLDTSGLQPCGYVLGLYVYDRAIVNSAWTGRWVTTTIGFCLE